MTAMTGQPEQWQMVMEILTRIERRLDGFVTTTTHAADMRRIDDAISNITADLAIERATRAEGQAKADARLDALMSALAVEAESRRKGDERDLATVREEIDEARDAGKQDRQWLVMAIIGLAGVVVVFVRQMVGV